MAIDFGICWIFWIPSGNLTKLLKITIFNGKIHYKWSFSIATLNYQRVVFIEKLLQPLIWYHPHPPGLNSPPHF
jgi:hypothetical protein